MLIQSRVYWDVGTSMHHSIKSVEILTVQIMKKKPQKLFPFLASLATVAVTVFFNYSNTCKLWSRDKCAYLNKSNNEYWIDRLKFCNSDIPCS